jgi:hypothetical protein
LDELHDKGEINIEFSPWEEEPVENTANEITAEYIKNLYEEASTLDGWTDVGYTTVDEIQKGISDEQD